MRASGRKWRSMSEGAIVDPRATFRQRENSMVSVA
jgi:hypothetical protein